MHNLKKKGKWTGWGYFKEINLSNDWMGKDVQQLWLICLRLRDDGFEWERDEEVTLAFVELALELNPVQSEGVKKRGEALHEAENGHG